jgi:hypothetical protein
MSANLDDGLARDRVARFAGAVFLAFVLTSVLASSLGNIGLSDADSLYTTITSDTTMFRLALVSSLLSACLFLLAAWGLYVLLHPVNRHLALLFLVLNAVGVAVQCASMLPLISAMQQGDPASHMQAYSPEQLEGLAYLSIGVYKTVFVTAQLFYSAWLFPLGYLVYKSGFLPKFLGVLLILDGIANLFWFVRALLLPDYPALNYPGWVISFIAEVGLALWLLIKGVKARPDASQLTEDAG